MEAQGGAGARLGGGGEDADQVLVLGESDEAIRQHVRDIFEAHQASMESASQGRARGFDGKLEAFYGSHKRQGVLQRLEAKDARPVLWKVFMCGKQCNLMTEIWIEDKKNPEVKIFPSKAYVIVHVHHHKTVQSAQNLQDLLKPESWGAVANLLVDAVNARHLLERNTNAKSPAQYDNPFYEQHGSEYFSTAIEASGSTLKLFPKSKVWACACANDNPRSKAKCSKGAHPRPCGAWNWRTDDGLDQGLAKLLKEAHGKASTWLGGGKKDSVLRGGGGAGWGGAFWTLADVRKLEARATFGRAMGLFVGIDEYDDPGLPNLGHCEADARSMAEGLQKAAGEAASCMEVYERPDKSRLLDSVDSFERMASEAAREPGGVRLLLLYFAGHGMRLQKTDHVLASDFKPGSRFGLGAVRVQELIGIFSSEALDGVEKYLVFDCCRDAPAPLVGGEGGGHGFGHELRDSAEPLPANTLVVFATQAGDSAEDGSSEDAHGPLCQALLGDNSSPSSQGIFAPHRLFVNLVHAACRRYSERRRQEGKGRAMLITEGMSSEVALGELREQAEEALRKVLVSDNPRCCEVTTRGAAVVETILAAEAAGQACIPSPPQEGPLSFSSDGDGDERLPLDDTYNSDKLSGASTPRAWSDDEGGEGDVEVLCQSIQDVSLAPQGLRQLEALVARMVDTEAILEEFWGDAEGRDALLGAVDDKVTGLLRSSGVLCDKRMLRALEPQVLGELPAPERSELAQMSLRHAKARAEMLCKVQERARTAYFKVVGVEDTGSFTASLRAPKWLVPILNALLEGHGGFRRAVWGFGFKKFQLGGVTVVLYERVVGEGGKMRVDAHRSVRESMHTHTGPEQASHGDSGQGIGSQVRGPEPSMQTASERKTTEGSIGGGRGEQEGRKRPREDRGKDYSPHLSKRSASVGPASYYTECITEVQDRVQEELDSIYSLEGYPDEELDSILNCLEGYSNEWHLYTTERPLSSLQVLLLCRLLHNDMSELLDLHGGGSRGSMLRVDFYVVGGHEVWVRVN